MKIKTDELTGLALDLAVAKCEGLAVSIYEGKVVKTWHAVASRSYRSVWSPSTNWGIGGPIIEREQIHLSFRSAPVSAQALKFLPLEEEDYKFAASFRLMDENTDGEEVYDIEPRYIAVRAFTPLVAAMRCYVESKLGYEVDLDTPLYADAMAAKYEDRPSDTFASARECAIDEQARMMDDPYDD